MMSVTVFVYLCSMSRVWSVVGSNLIFLRKSDCLGCAVLLCFVVCLTLLASFFLPSHLSLLCVCVCSVQDGMMANIHADATFEFTTLHLVVSAIILSYIFVYAYYIASVPGLPRSVRV